MSFEDVESFAAATGPPTFAKVKCYVLQYR